MAVQLARLVRRRDWALAIGVTLLWQVEVWTIALVQPPGDILREPYSTGERAIASAVGLAFTLSLAWRRRTPLAVLALAIVVAMASRSVTLIDAATTSAIALVVVAYSVGAHAEGRAAALGVLGVVALIVATVPAFSLQDVAFVTMILGGAWLAGKAIRRWRERERTLRRLTEELEREREDRARTAVAAERVRIARELHDVVAHAIGVIVLQARGGRRSLATDPDEAREALDAIEATGSQALTEMRRLVGMLRTDDELAALAPQPSLRYLDALAAQVREAGLPVEVVVEGRPIELPPGVDMSAYRIVQEALTNVVKHAGPANARVVVRYGAADVELDISDSGARAASKVSGGHGLVGIRERVAMYGGELEAGPRPEGGFRLRARLPVETG